MGTLLHSCAEVREPIELSFGVVSGVGGWMGELNGVHVPQGEGGFRGGLASIGFNGEFVQRKVFDLCIKS